jgi:hypothetical protein
MLGYLALAGVVFGVNLLPAFGPPTWSGLVFFRLQSNVPAVPLVLIGALAYRFTVVQLFKEPRLADGLIGFSRCVVRARVRQTTTS